MQVTVSNQYLVTLSINVLLGNQIQTGASSSKQINQVEDGQPSQLQKIISKDDISNLRFYLIKYNSNLLINFYNTWNIYYSLFFKIYLTYF